MMEEQTAAQQAVTDQEPSAPATPGEEIERRNSESVEHPAKVMRIATMVRQLLEEVRQANLDEPSRERMRDVYETSVRELGEVLSPDLKDELGRLSLPFEAEAPSESELRVAHAQLVGWLEGLFHGIQAMLFAQQAESRARFEEVRRRSLPVPDDQAPQSGAGQYL